MTRVANAALRGDVRFQALPVPSQMFVAGLDAPIFEETAGRRYTLMRSKSLSASGRFKSLRDLYTSCALFQSPAR